MLGFLGILILSFLFQAPQYQLCIVALTGVLAFWIKIPLRKIGGMMVPLIPIVISIILITGFTFAPERFARISSQTILFYALPGNRLGATLGGFLMGTTFVLRLFGLMIASSDSIGSYLPIMIPLFINSILMANSLSMAMLNRG